jgi:hypothetical protein
LFEDGSDVQVTSASAEFLAPSGSGFRAERTGTAALLARRTVDGVTVDFTHLSIENPSRIDIETSSGDPIALVMVSGARQELVAIPVDAEEAPLAGALPFEWQTSDPNVLELELGSGGSRMNVLGQTAGSATLTVSSGELTRAFDVVVQ